MLSLRGSKILVADDDPVIRNNLRTLLESEHYQTVEAADGRQASAAFEAENIVLALLDLRMPECSGLDLLRQYQDRLEEIPVIIITALGGSAAAIEAMKLGAYDYITKPFDLDEVLYTIRRALAQTALVAQVQALTEWQGRHEKHPQDLIGKSPAMMAVFKLIGKVATTDEPVLILGESGTGKELVAHAIHRNSQRSAGPFVAVNCAAINPTLLESEFFGHERGAFTGAVANRAGRFKQAHGGTLFLDEIGDLDIDLQAKFLRALQTGQIEPVGGNRSIHVNVRLLAATNRILPDLIAKQRFREDLYYRLNVFTIDLPSLRARSEDIPVLVEHFIQELARKYQWPHLGLSRDAITMLCDYRWPGNVRELQNVLARAALMTRGRLVQPTDLEAVGLVISQGGVEPEETSGCYRLKKILGATEKRVISEALEHTHWNRTLAAKLLGISRRQLFDKILEYGLIPSR
jgi:two-component system response regulator AtoC